MRFAGLVQGQDLALDLVVTAEEGYRAYNSSRNGLLGGNGQVNAKSGTTVALHFTFVEAGTNTPYALPQFYFTFSDLDERHGGTEKEMVAVEGFDKYYTNDDLSVVGRETEVPAFESVDFGSYADNDMHPDSPTPLQLTHAVSFQFLNKATFRATFIVSQQGDDIKGRNVVFSGISQLVFCKEPSTYLDFRSAEVTSNNLGGLGPNLNDAEEIRYSRVGVFEGGALDLVVTADKDISQNWTYKPWNVSQNGLNGEFGIVNLFSGEERHDSEVHLHFAIVQSGTSTPVVLDAFAFMFFDFDTGLHEQQIEYVELSPTQPGFGGGAGFASYLVTGTTELNITEQDELGCYKFTATKHGTAADNPTSSMMLAREEADRSVAFTFRKSAEFRVTFGITPNGYNTGRNLMFAGQDMYLMCD
jgi:hypothetical protein